MLKLFIYLNSALIKLLQILFDSADGLRESVK